MFNEGHKGYLINGQQIKGGFRVSLGSFSVSKNTHIASFEP